jgi:tRNA-2-methylthio-N6-dimethylallyladenosine synthase
MPFPPGPRWVYIETYGCQMNLADSELVGGILHREGYAFTDRIEEADVVLLNTCAIRENAEQRIYGRLGYISTFKRQNPDLIIGILGCMAERLRRRFVEEEKLVDVVVGPDEYRKLPSLVDSAFGGEKGIAVQLSRVENYDDIVPLRTDGISAWVSVMRGCDKFCTFCVVPFTRGRERSRATMGIVQEVAELAARGFKEVTLLGQNVNSYRDGEHDFANLLLNVASIDRSLRIRFMTSHPQDMSDKLIEAIASTDNLCKYIHLPVQSGSDRILALMNRTYTVEHYLKLVEKIRRTIPGVGLSTDVISGFPSELEEDHQMTIDLMHELKFDGAYTFKYSPRERTKAWEMADNIPEEVKGGRVNEITQHQHQISLERNSVLIGTVERVLVEGPSKKSGDAFSGRTDTNKTVVFPKLDEAIGQYVDIHIDRVTSATLFGRHVAAECGNEHVHQPGRQEAKA